VLVEIAGRLPVRVSYFLSSIASMILWVVSRRIRSATRNHARHVLGPGADSAHIDRIARSMVRSAGYYYADFSRLASVPPERVFEEVEEVHGIEHLFSALDEGRGVILIGAHLGGSEILAQAMAPFGLCLAVITEPLSPPPVHRYVESIRAHHGVRYFPATAGGLRSSVAHLRGGGTLGLLVDRDVLGTAEPFPFFGERAPLPSGAVDLARRTGAPIVAGWVPRTAPGRYQLFVERVDMPPPTHDRVADLESGMRAMTAALESAIRRWPGQWFALARVWARDDRTS